MEKSKTGKIILIIIIALVLIVGIITGAIFLINRNSNGNGIFEKEEVSNAEFTKLPAAEKIRADFKGSYADHFFNEDYSERLFVLNGKIYSANDNKIYIKKTGIRWSNSFTTNFYSAVIESGGYEMVPVNDKNVLYYDKNTNYSIELENTGDTSVGFLAFNNDNFICISKSHVKAFNINTGSQLWSSDPIGGSCFFATKAENYRTDGNKLIIDTYNADDTGHLKNYENTLVINLNEGSVKKLEVVGKDGKKMDCKAKDLSFCGDYLIKSDSASYVIDDSSKIIGKINDNCFGTRRGYLIKECQRNAEKARWEIYDEKFNLMEKTLPYNYAFGSKATATRTYGDLTYTSGKPGFNSLVVDNEGNMMTEGIPSDEDIFACRKIGLENYQDGDDIDNWKYGWEIINLYTGKTLKNYKLVDGRQSGDVAHVSDENGKEYLINSNLEIIYTFDTKTTMKHLESNKDSKYIVYCAIEESKYSLYVIDKENYERTKIDFAEENNNLNYYSKFLINGDYVLYRVSNGECSKLHAYNAKDKKDDVIFTTESKDESISFESGANQSNNWFYVEKSYERGTKHYYDIYRLK